jgi:hypothetical protein
MPRGTPNGGSTRTMPTWTYGERVNTEIAQSSGSHIDARRAVNNTRSPVARSIFFGAPKGSQASSD